MMENILMLKLKEYFCDPPFHFKHLAVLTDIFNYPRFADLHGSSACFNTF